MKELAKIVQHRETAEEVAAYRAAAASANVRHIRLVSSLFELKPEGLDSNQTEWIPGYSCITQHADYSEEHRSLSAFIEAEAFCRSGKKKVISVKCKYIVTYSVDGHPDRDAALRFAGHVGRFAAYPYFRAHFAELMSQAGLSLPPLPVMREGKRIIGQSDEEPIALP